MGEKPKSKSRPGDQLKRELDDLLATIDDVLDENPEFASPDE